MEETNRPLPSPEAPERWADLSGPLPPDSRTLLAAWMAGRALPRRLFCRRVIGIVALAALLGCAVWSVYVLFHGTPVLWWMFLVPLPLVLLVLVVLKDMPLHRQLRRWLKQIRGLTLFPDHLRLVTQAGTQELPLAELTLVQRFDGWTVLAWQDGARPLLVPIPDSACDPRRERPYARLRQAVPDTLFRDSWQPPRRRRHLVICLLLILVGFLTSWTLLLCSLGAQILLDRSSTGDYMVVGYARKQNRLIAPDGSPFPSPATGDPKFQWLSNRCCAVTYLSTDGTTRVRLLEPLQGDVARLDPDPPAGAWTGESFTTGSTVTLRWDEERSGYCLLTQEGETFYPTWEEFDGLGIALCDDSGLPRWTVTPSLSPLALLFNGEYEPALQLCPVSMEEAHTVLLYSADDAPDAA